MEQSFFTFEDINEGAVFGSKDRRYYVDPK
jgi:hypothetical protein